MRIFRLLVPLLLFWTMASAAHAAGSLKPVDKPPQGAQIVHIGFYPITIYGLDPANDTFYADTYVWMRWKGDIDPTGTIEFVNAVEEWGMQKENIQEEPSELPDGSKYQIMRVEGRFFQPFSLAKFPLDSQKLSILVEDTTNGADVLSYVIDRESSGISDTLSVPGWNLNGWGAQSFVHDYGTKFGETGSTAASTYSALRFNLKIERPINYFIWKLLLPLVIVLGATWVVLLLDPKLVEVRTAMPATALLTTVFLQQSYSASLPEVGYLVLLDKIYVIAYLLIILTLIRVIVMARSVEHAEGAGNEAIKKADRMILLAEVAVFAIGTVIVILTR